MLAGGLGYLIAQERRPVFRGAVAWQIRQDMRGRRSAPSQAEARAAAVDRRLANLEAEIAALRAESARKKQAETERFARHTAAEIAKIEAHAEQEIAAAGKAARLELKRYAARAGDGAGGAENPARA